MTHIEYITKRQNFATSSAPQEQIDKAIKKLDEAHLTVNSTEKAMQQYRESLPDTSDIKGED